MIDAALVDPVLFIRWRERCDQRDVDRILKHVSAAHRIVGERLVYVSIIPVGIPPPDTETRASLREGTAAAKEFCASIHLVIEGEGLRRALTRSILAGLLLATGGSFKTHSDVRLALEAAKGTVPMDVDAVVGQATQKGLMTVT